MRYVGGEGDKIEIISKLNLQLPKICDLSWK